MTVAEVKALRGRPARMTFIDGLVLDARVLDVVDDQDHDQLGFLVLGIVAPGSGPRPQLKVGHPYASDLSELVSATARELGT